MKTVFDRLHHALIKVAEGKHWFPSFFRFLFFIWKKAFTTKNHWSKTLHLNAFDRRQLNPLRPSRTNLYDWHQQCFENLQLLQIWRYERYYLLLWQSDKYWSVRSQLTGYKSEFWLQGLFVLQQIRKCSFSTTLETNKKRTSLSWKFFNEKIILNPDFYIQSKLQAFCFPFTTEMLNQTFSRLNKYHSISAMLTHL